MNDNELVVEREMFSLYGRKYFLSDYVWSVGYLLCKVYLIARVFTSELLWF